MNLEIKSKLQSLLTAANTKTGESDATLTDAVQTLVDGYGQGGGDFGNLSMHSGEFTVSESSVTSFQITHGFSSFPILLVVYPKEPVNNSSSNVIGGVAVVRSPTLTKLVKSLPTADSDSAEIRASGWYTSASKPTGAVELVSYSYIKSVTSTTFTFDGSSSYPILPGTYVWLAYGVEDE